MRPFTSLLAFLLLSFSLLHTTTASNRHTRLPPLSSTAPRSRPPPSGDIYLHDTSGVVYENTSSLYFLFASGILPKETVASLVSSDGYTWKRSSKPVFASHPAWIKERVPNAEVSLWAPDIVYLNGLWHLYYAASSGGSQNSCIGLAVNKALDPLSPLFQWQDAGPVLCSNDTLPYNCIDQHIFLHPDDGTVWMNFGSYWHGLYIIQLTGNPIVSTPVGSPVNIATHNVEIHPIEASWVQPHKRSSDNTTEFWLFADWGYCCRGLNSTYEIRVGRSTTGPLGPYLDKTGVAMVDGGGTLIVDSQTEQEGRQIGPGQIGFPWGGGKASGNISAPVISYFYYDREGNPPGQFTFGQALFVWGDGKGQWPYVTDRE